MLTINNAMWYEQGIGGEVVWKLSDGEWKTTLIEYNGNPVYVARVYGKLVSGFVNGVEVGDERKVYVYIDKNFAQACERGGKFFMEFDC